MDLSFAHFLNTAQHVKPSLNSEALWSMLAKWSCRVPYILNGTGTPV